jgi:hypothetical protein
VDDEVRLWYHPESDALFLDGEGPFDCDDVTMEARFRTAAQDRGIDISVLPTLAHVEPIQHIAEVTSGAELMARHTMADAIVASYKKWERKPADLYPTPVNAVEAIIEMIKLFGVKKVWEPACGDGRIARVLEWHGLEVLGTDIREFPGYGYGGLDFINEDPIDKWGLIVDDCDMVMTNPPFSLAREFIEKALGMPHVKVVIMLVKQNYYNTDNRYDFFEDMRPSFFLPLTWRLAFLPERGKSPLMDCAWAVWVKDADDLFDGAGRPVDGCIMQPVRKKVYPGYHGPGLKSAMAALTEAVDELAGAIRG